MSEYARRFFALLNQAYRIEADEHIKGITTGALAMADPRERQKHLDQLQRVSDGIMPGENSDDYSGLESLKKEL